MQQCKQKGCDSYALNNGTDYCDVCNVVNENKELWIAMNDLLKSPKGVVPDSASKFYNYAEGYFKI